MLAKSNVNIRTAKQDDLDAVYILNQEFARAYKAEDKLTLSKEQLKKDSHLFNCRVALVDEVIVGFSTFFVAYYTWVGKSMYLDDLFVTQEYRRQGIGEMLLDDVIAIAEASECKRVVWQVSDWNQKAQKFYLEKGALLASGEMNCVYVIE